MNVMKMSLAALMTVGALTSVNAADTLADAFKNGTLKGELRAWYWDRSIMDGAKSDGLLNLGVNLGYVTDSYNGFKLGTTFQSSNSPFASETAKVIYAGDEYGPGAVLSEAYLSYSAKKSTLKVGRQYIKTPLIASSPSRIIKQSFEGATLASQILPETVLFAAYIDKFQNRTDGTGDIADFSNNFWSFSPIPGLASYGSLDGDAYSLMIANKSIPGVTLTGQWVGIKDFANVYYAEAKYNGKKDNYRYGLYGQYQITDFDNTISSDDSGYYGLKASAGFGPLNGYVAYSKIGDDNIAIPGVGGGPYGTIYTSQMWLTPGTFNKGTEAYTIDANYMFKSIGLMLGARYSNVDIITDEIKFTTLYSKYKFNGALKGLSVMAGYENGDANTVANNKKEFRFNLSYSF